MNVNDLSELTQSERENLGNKYAKWKVLRAGQSWTEADTLRDNLVSAGVDLESGSWHPVFESSAHRYSRFKARESNLPI